MYYQTKFNTKCHVNRREFLKKTAIVGASVGLAGLGSPRLVATEVRNGASNADKLGWRLGMQAWTLNRTTLFDALEQTASLGLHYIETFPGQKLDGQWDHTMGESLPPNVRKAIKQKMSDLGITMVSYGIYSPTANLDKSRKTFEFVKDMGGETILTEATEKDLDMLEKLSDEYEMNLTLHNHAKPSRYWNPDTVLKVCKCRSSRIGACADTGHWLRSGLNPTECLKKLEGRIITLHFKDRNNPSPSGHDVPYGTGVCDVKGMLAEIHRQGIKPAFFIEYEHNWGKSLPDISKCVKYFDRVSTGLVAKG